MAQLLFTGADICQSMQADIKAAKKSIKIEQYIIFDDRTGRIFLDLLQAKAIEGVQIKLSLDGVGCRAIRGDKSLEIIKDHGGRVRFYNRLRWSNALTPHRWFPRNHSKVMIIDDSILHIGSACFADYMAGWREAHVRLVGKIVHDMGQDMITDGDSGDVDPHFRHMSTHPGHRNAIYREMLARIDDAQKTLWLATPYFTPPIMLQRAIRRALARGVDVRLLTGEKTDVPIARLVGQTYFNKLMKRGARIFLYQPDIMHAKYMIVDGIWAKVGSVNLDYLSLLRNREAMLCIQDHATIQDLAHQFEQDCTNNSQEIDRSFWKEVPWIEKVIGYLGRAMKKVL